MPFVTDENQPISNRTFSRFCERNAAYKLTTEKISYMTVSSVCQKVSAGLRRSARR